MDREMYLAYDGSINSDWVARYALQMTSCTPGRQITLLHIEDGTISQERLELKLEALAHAGKMKEVDLRVLVLRQQGDVLTTLLGAIPAGERTYCICGTRATSSAKGFLAGTISQKLLRLRQFNTLALRVVNPGLLGCPGNVMFPLSGHPRKFEGAMPFLLMLAPCIRKLILLRIMTVNSLVLRYLSAARAGKIQDRGAVYIQDVMREVVRETGNYTFLLDDHVLISDDWAREILVQAGKAHAGLILLGAGDHFLQSRFYFDKKIERILRRPPCDIGIYRKI
jgi:hypothetical protein